MQNANINADLLSLISSKTYAVYDYEFIRALRRIPWSNWLNQEKTFRIREEYLCVIHAWIYSSELNLVTGLERFTSKHLINGTTQTFDEFYHRHAQRRLRFFRCEYAYHRRCFANWKFIEDEPIDKNDFLIISIPFCSTVDKHPLYEETLKICTQLNVPVIIDCAYYGTCMGLHIDVNERCIESVSFSLSKGIGLGDIRSGIRYSFFDDYFPISQQNKYDHTVLAAAKIGLYMMQEFSPDFIPKKYRNAQIAVCHALGVRSAPRMHLALGDPAVWNIYRIDDMYCRIGIRDAVKKEAQKKIIL